MLIITEHINELEKKFIPYIENRDNSPHLREDAPADVVEAYEEYKRFFWNEATLQ